MLQYMIYFAGGLCGVLLNALAWRLRVTPIQRATIKQMAQLYLAAAAATVLGFLATENMAHAGLMAGVLTGVADVMIRMLPKEQDEQE